MISKLTTAPSMCVVMRKITLVFLISIGQMSEFSSIFEVTPIELRIEFILFIIISWFLL